MVNSCNLTHFVQQINYILHRQSIVMYVHYSIHHSLCTNSYYNHTTNATVVYLMPVKSSQKAQYEMTQIQCVICWNHQSLCIIDPFPVFPHVTTGAVQRLFQLAADRQQYN